MKKTKKLCALALAMVLALCLGAPAFAAGENPSFTDATSVNIRVIYKLVGEGTSPAEDFTLRQVDAGKVKDGDAVSVPDLLGISKASFAAGDATTVGAEKTFTVTLPVYEKVGVYEYILEQAAGETAGVTYHGNKIKLVVTVINDAATGTLRVAAVHTENVGDPDKTDHFTNTYSAGTLNITKTVAGNLGDKTKYFKFTVTLTGEGSKAYAPSYTVTGGSKLEDGRGDAASSTIEIGTSKEFYLKHEETLSIANLPYGVSYKVEEATPADYVLNATNATGSINSASVTAVFTNTKGVTVDTGVVLDSLPYVLTLAVVALAAVVLFLKKRAAKNR